MENTTLAASIWPLLDTSIKIALGALIAAGSAWFALRYRAFQYGEKNHPNRRIQLLEEISSEVGNVSHIFAKYSSLAIESIHYGHQWPQIRKQELGAVNTELVTEFKKMASAEAKLLMLGEKSMEKTLHLYGAKIAHFRKQVYVGRQDISTQEIADLKQAIGKLREQFYDQLSKRYDRLLTKA